MDESVARGIAADVRRAINDFRDDRRAEIVRARDRLLLNVMLTSWTVFVAVVVATITQIPRESVQALVAFSVLGSLTGLANAMRLQSRVSRATDDYGLFEARLLYTLLVSGIAAIGGVLLVGVAPTLTGAITVSSPPPMPSLASIFDASKPANLLVAISFGLVPEAFFGNLRRQAELLRKDLESTTAAGSSSTPPP